MRPLFWKFKVFRNNFLIYLGVLSCIGVLLIWLIGMVFLSRSVMDYRKQSLELFQNMVKNSDDQPQRAENFLQSVYSDPTLLNDFLNYFDNTAEEYYTERLLDAEGSMEMEVAFVDACKRFSSQTNGSLVQIHFCSRYPGDQYNAIFFRPSGSVEYAFQIAEEALKQRTEPVAYEYWFAKTLPNPIQVNSSIGEVEFRFDLSPLLQSSKGNQPFSIYASNGNTVTLIKGEQELESQIADILHQGKTQGTFQKNAFLSFYYMVCHSDSYGFSVVTTLDTWTIMQENALLLFVTVLSVLFCLGVVLSIIGVRMNFDATYLNQILAFIYDFQNGNFVQKKIPQRHDEYSLIADALNDMSDKIKTYIEKEYLLKLEQQQAEMAALENQINPHFLYNTLEIIRSKACVNGDQVVADAIYSLGSMYRSVIKTSHRITIEQELAMVTQYLKLMEIKYEDHFYYQIEVTSEIQKLETVKFWMQPIVENFFVHGYQRENSYNILIVVGEETPENYILKFVNNGRMIESDTLEKLNAMMKTDYMETENSVGRIGLQNVYLRLHYFYGSRLSMEVSNNPEGGVTVRIQIRKEKPCIVYCS